MTEVTGQKYSTQTVFTSDMQLDKVGVGVMWSDPEAFSNEILKTRRHAYTYEFCSMCWNTNGTKLDYMK